MYHVIGTGLTAIIFYLLSFCLYRLGYYSLQFHRKIWNSILAVTFIFAASAGILMALQINYKWNIPIIKSVLKWHVEFGVGMTFTGIFHFLWHLSYFTNIFRKADNGTDNQTFQQFTSTEISINMFVIGLVSTALQLLLIREMMNISGGYELIVGTFLGSWLVCSAIGASLAGKSKLKDIRKINLLFSLSPLISLFFLFFFSRLFLNSGETPSFLLSVIYTFLVLLPFCMISGFTFVKIIYAANTGNSFLPGKSFSIETTGGVAAGVIISLLTSELLNTYQLILLIILLSLTYVLLTFFIFNSNRKNYVKVLAAILAAAIILLNPDIFFRKILLPGLNVTESHDTPYGNITQGEYKVEQSIYYNHRLLSYSEDVIEREEDIHYAMLQSETPSKVMVISGSLRSHLPEILKYPVSKVLYIERDPALAALENVPLRESPEVVISNDDAFRFIGKRGELFDVIILLVPPPSTLLLNRYYTVEFFNEVKNRLNPGGVFMCAPGPGDLYLNKESLNMYSSIFGSLSDVFKSVIPVVGNKLYLIASDKQLSSSLSSLAEIKNISNIYVSRDYLSDDLTVKKTEETAILLNNGTRHNRYSYPVACFYFQSYNFSKNLGEKIPVILLMFILFAVPFFTVKKRNMLMYFSALSLAGFEIIILITLQLTAGNMYQLTGLIIGGIMTGLALGAAYDLPLLSSYTTKSNGIALMLFYLLSAFAYNYSILLRSEILIVIILLLFSFLPALITGNIFRLLTKEQGSLINTSSLYSADLAGSALGFILMSGISVPILGIRVSIFLLAFIMIAGILFGTIRNKL